MSYLTTKYINTEEYNIEVIEFDNTEDGLEQFEISSELNNNISDYNDTDLLKLVENNFDNLISKKDSTFTLNKELLSSKLKFKIANIAYYIGANGKIGPANTLIMCSEFIKYLDDDFVKKYEIFIDDDCVDKIYIYRKNTDEQPGSIFVHNDTKFSIVNIGFYPEKQIECLYIN